MPPTKSRRRGKSARRTKKSRKMRGGELLKNINVETLVSNVDQYRGKYWEVVEQPLFSWSKPTGPRFMGRLVRAKLVRMGHEGYHEVTFEIDTPNGSKTQTININRSDTFFNEVPPQSQRPA